ncbi:hypothetical protein [Streptomyces sp. NPDC096012]|uniref:hypothetical protein n=1 Tax=Streptomyces sp. NPDC096012 TaxID=3155684 RepID=UPI00336A2910
MQDRYLYLARDSEATPDEGELTEAGRRQAELLGGAPGLRTADGIHHGPLPRAAQMARLIEVVEATIDSGYAFHTLPAAWDEVLGRFDAGAMRFVEAPVLILNGEKDTVFRAGEADFSRAHPHARVELIPRARHLANFDDPDAFTDAVRRFARQLRKGRGRCPGGSAGPSGECPRTTVHASRPSPDSDLSHET